MKQSRRCASCGKSFLPRPNVPHQAYCSSPLCQRERRYRWHKQQLAVDSDYRANQRHAQLAWHERNPDYWREYREQHPDYCQRNRDQQHLRNSRRSKSQVAKPDESPVLHQMPGGVYRLKLLIPSPIASTDEYLVKISVLSVVSPDAQRLQRDDL